MIRYTRLRKVKQQTHREIRGLVHELLEGGDEHYSVRTLARAVRDQNVYILTARERGAIVGMGTLVVMLTPSGAYGMIGGVVVAGRMRGQGIGRALMERLIAEAKRRKLPMLELTSNPRRIAANHLYPSLGFKKRETNVYRLLL